MAAEPLTLDLLLPVLWARGRLGCAPKVNEVPDWLVEQWTVGDFCWMGRGD